jgi:hypothetical protein
VFLWDGPSAVQPTGAHTHNFIVAHYIPVCNYRMAMVWTMWFMNLEVDLREKETRETVSNDTRKDVAHLDQR